MILLSQSQYLVSKYFVNGIKKLIPRKMLYQNIAHTVSKRTYFFPNRMTPYQRLEKIAEKEKRTLVQLVSMTGRSSSIVSAIRNGKKDLSDGLAEAIAEKFGYRKDWILTGDGEMKDSIIQSGIAKAVGPLRGVRVLPESELFPILKTPLYARAGFGYVAYLNRPPQEQEWDLVPLNKLYPGIPPEDHTIVTVNGDSMEPRMEAGWEMLAYRMPEGQFPRIGKHVMLDFQDELIIKTLVGIDWENRNVVVQSYNNKETKVIPLDEIRRVFHVYDYHKAML